MSGRRSRDKGSRGQREASHLLVERGWTVIDLGPGRASEDIIATDERGCLFSCEVKYQRLWRLEEWRRQAKEQARKRTHESHKGHKWLMLCRVPQQPGTFYVEGCGIESCVWRGNISRKDS